MNYNYLIFFDTAFPILKCKYSSSKQKDHFKKNKIEKRLGRSAYNVPIYLIYKYKLIKIELHSTGCLLNKIAVLKMLTCRLIVLKG